MILFADDCRKETCNKYDKTKKVNACNWHETRHVFVLNPSFLILRLH